MESSPETQSGTVHKSGLDYARSMDETDPLASFRSEFYLPRHPHYKEQDSIYLCGNSLGCQPRSLEEYLKVELEDWARLGVEGHVHGRNPWLYYHHFAEESMARIVGAHPSEVVVMNGLTVNLNLLMVSFYRPTKRRYKILMEEKAFPSDQYAAEMQARYHARTHGFNPDEAVVEVKPRPGEHSIREEDMLAAIEEAGDELALLLLGGVNYYTGQLFDLKAVTQKARQVGAVAGLDLAHAAGNVHLELSAWGVDFAVWCTYKYLNSGPGGVAGVFVHDRHNSDKSLPRFAGWWGNDEKTRFEMKPGFHPQKGAASWQMSNAPVLSIAALRSSLEIFDRAGMPALHAKSAKLTSYMDFLLAQISSDAFEVITPASRGCQLSILTGSNGRALFEALSREGIIVDWREPNVIRLAPVPLYNSFEDVYRFARILEANC